MTQIRHCDHSDWVVCDACGPKPAPKVSEEDVERVMKILDAAHQDIWMKLKPKTLRSMAAHIVIALRAQATDTPTQIGDRHG